MSDNKKLTGTLIPKDNKKAKMSATFYSDKPIGSGGDSEIFDEYVDATDQQRNTALANVSNQTANSTTGKMGYKVLDPIKTFAEQVTAENTIYEIRDVFDLGGTQETPVNVTLPTGGVLKFNGGMIKNCTIVGDNTVIQAPNVKIFDEVDFSGTFINNETYPEWFGYDDSALSIASCFKLCGVVKFTPNKVYDIYTTLDIKGGQTLIGGDEVQSYEGEYLSRKAVINSKSANLIRLYSGGTIKGLTLQMSNDVANNLLDTDYLLGIGYLPSGQINGVPGGTNIFDCYLNNNVSISANTYYIDAASGCGIKFLSSEAYNINIINTGIKAFKYGILASDTRIYIMNFASSRFDYCRHAIWFKYVGKFQIDFVYQGSTTNVQNGTDEPLIKFVEKSSYGYIDGMFFDFLGEGQSGNRYYFSNPLYIPTFYDDSYDRDSVNSWALNNIVIGPSLRRTIGKFKRNYFPNNFKYANVSSSYASGSYPYITPNRLTNIFHGRKIGTTDAADCKFSKSSGINWANGTYPTDVFCQTLNGGDSVKGKMVAWKKTSFQDSDYVEFNFSDLTKVYTANSVVNNNNIMLYDCCATFSISQTPKIILYTFALHNNNGHSDFTVKVAVVSCRLTIDEAKQIYDAIQISGTPVTDSNTIWLEESMGEFSVRNIYSLYGANETNKSVTSFIRSVNIKCFGAIASTGQVVMYDLSGTSSMSDMDNLTVRPNRWFGEQGFDGIVYLNGNKGTILPSISDVPEGTLFYDETNKKYVCSNGTAWVNLDGTALS